MGRVLFTREEVEGAVKTLAHKIVAKHKGERLLVIGVLKGAWIFMADLVRFMEMEVFCDFVRVASYTNKTDTSGRVCLSYWPDLDFSNERVLVVDDIADTGLTLAFLRKKFLDAGASVVELCAVRQTLP